MVLFFMSSFCGFIIWTWVELDCTYTSLNELLIGYKINRWRSMEHYCNYNCCHLRRHALFFCCCQTLQFGHFLLVILILLHWNFVLLIAYQHFFYLLVEQGGWIIGKDPETLVMASYMRERNPVKAKLVFYFLW